jgi:hypothetical protein
MFDPFLNINNNLYTYKYSITPDPSTHAYFPLRGMVLSSLFIFFEKTKEAPNPKVKILCLERQISIYTVAQKA